MSQADLWSATADILSRQSLGPPLAPLPRGSEVPLSFAQERLWRLQRSEPDTPYYHVPLAWRIQGPLDRRALEKAINAVVARHEALRTVFRAVDTAPVASVAEPSPVPFRFVAESPDTVLRVATESVRRPFSLAEGPLLRAELYHLGGESHLFVITAHQIAFDGWSKRVLCRELDAFYRAFRDGALLLLPPCRLQYPDFAHWQRQTLRGEALAAEVAYWRANLGQPYTPLALPTDHPRPHVETGPGARRDWTLDKDLTQSLSILGRDHGATLFAVLVASLQALVYRHTGQEDVIVFASTADRVHPDLKKLIGLVANVVPLRTSLAGRPSFGSLLRQVREVTLGAFAHQGLPFSQIAELLHHSGGAPLFQVMFIYQNAPMADLALDGTTSVSIAELDKGAAKFDLFFEAANTPGGLRGWLSYRADLYDTATIDRLLASWRTIVETVVADPAAPLSAGRPPCQGTQLCARRGPAVAPRDCIEMQLAASCCESFGIDHVGVTDDFLALGGNSLTVMLMLTRIEAATGFAVSLADLLQAPTVAELAVLLRGRGCVPRLTLTAPVKPGGNRPPLFWIQGSEGGPVLACLLQSLDAEQPVYRISGTGLPLERLAKHAALEMREVQPQGPYYIGAEDHGAAPAFEIARTLAAAGERVPVLLLVRPHRDKPPQGGWLGSWRRLRARRAQLDAPRPYPGTIVLLCGPDEPSETARSWATVAAGIETIEVSGLPRDPASVATLVGVRLLEAQTQPEEGERHVRP